MIQLYEDLTPHKDYLPRQLKWKRKKKTSGLSVVLNVFTTNSYFLVTFYVCELHTVSNISETK